MATRKAAPEKKPATAKKPVAAKKTATAKKPVASKNAATAKKPVAAKKPATAKKAAAKKKPGAARRESVADRWAEGYKEFIEAARERFAFLVRDHGFTDPDVRVVPPDAVVTFTRGDSFVRIMTEYGGPPWVVVKAWEGEPYGLHVIIAALDAVYAAQKPVPAGSTLTNDELEELVAYYARFLAEHASAVLHADAALVARFREQESALRSQVG